MLLFLFLLQSVIHKILRVWIKVIYPEKKLTADTGRTTKIGGKGEDGLVYKVVTHFHPVITLLNDLNKLRSTLVSSITAQV